MKMSGLSNKYCRNRPSGLLTWLKPCFYVAVLLITSPAFADEYHYNNILIGDRAAGMGGAYTAISDDPSGLFYNPAGIVYAQGSNVSVSANAFHQTKTVYKDVLGGNGWERKSSALLPNFFGIIQPLGKGKLGFSYAVPDSILEDQDQVFYNVDLANREVINFNRNDNTYQFGPSYAMQISKRFSVGATLYAHYRENQWIFNRLTNFTTDYGWVNEYYQTSEWGVRPLLGLMWNPLDKLSLGFTLSQTKIITSNTVDQVTARKTTAGTNGPDNCDPTLPYYRCDNSNSEKRELPLTTTLGFAYFPSNTLIISGDFTYYDKTEGFHSDLGDDRVATWNAALGAEYYLNEKWALRGGLFTDRANTTEVRTGNGISDLDHVDLYGGSLSASYFTRQSSITFGGTYRYGIGKAEIAYDPNKDLTDQTQDVEMQASTYFLSASYFY